MTGCGIIIQARMGSTRLPGKTLMDIHGAGVLERQVRRLRMVRLADAFIYATTEEPEDQAVIRECERLDVPWYAGPAEDVLLRYLRCAEEHGLEVVLRVTGDNPLVDPAGLDALIELRREGRYDYINNIHREGSLKGTGGELVTLDALRESERRSTRSYHREHVTTFVKDNLGDFRWRKFVPANDTSRPGLSVSIDYPEDLEVARRVYGHFGGRDDMTAEEVVAFLDSHPEVTAINGGRHEPMARFP